jgi:hemerythrin-like domain-containing protein
MTAIELLEEDHQLAINLIDELESADDDAGTDPTNTETFNQLHEALKLHTRLEEEIFYPALESFDETRDLIKEAYKEHEKVDQLLARLSSKAPNEEEFQENLAELRSSIEQHVEEEEGEIFPKAEELLGASKLEQMGEQMQRAKDNAKVVAATMRRP